MKRKFFLALLGATLLTFGIGIGVLASSGLVEIKAKLNHDLKVKMDGQVVQLNDEQGHAVFPITYNGSTYLPVRAISNLVNVAVDYDHEAYEVILGERLDGVAIGHEKFNDVLYSKDPAQRTFGGKDYGEVLFATPGVNYNSTIITPDKKYQTLYLQITPLVKGLKHVEIKDLENNALLKKVENLSTEDGMQTIEVDIAGVKNVSIRVQKEHSDGGWMIPLKTSYYK